MSITETINRRVFSIKKEMGSKDPSKFYENVKVAKETFSEKLEKYQTDLESKLTGMISGIDGKV
jgi:hypothetical protein